MQVFFQGEASARHQVLPFVAVDGHGNWGVWYSDDRQGCSFGPYFGRRSNDPLASWRAMQLCSVFVASAPAISEATVKACWDLGFDADFKSAAAEEVRAVVGDQAVAGVHESRVPSMDAVLEYAIQNDLSLAMEGMLKAIKADKMTCTPLAAGCCTSGLLLINGRLTRDYQRAFYTVRTGRSGGAEPLVRDYIDKADAIFREHLVTLERSFSKINKMLPGTEAATATVKQEKGLLQTITARFRKADVVDPAVGQIAALRKQIGMERIACGEALTNIRKNHSNQHPYADMKMPNYHTSLTRFATGLLSFSNKLADYLADNAVTDDVRDQAEEVRSNLDELRIWLNLTINSEMDGIYTLGLPQADA